MKDDPMLVAALQDGRKVAFRTVWMDPFDVESCCQKGGMEESSRGMILNAMTSSARDRLLRCRYCGRYWVRDAETGGLWTRRL